MSVVTTHGTWGFGGDGRVGSWIVMFHSVHMCHMLTRCMVCIHIFLFLSRLCPIRHAPEDLVWGLAPGMCTEPQIIPTWILHCTPGLLASTSETEIGPWGRGGHSAVSGAGPGPAV